MICNNCKREIRKNSLYCPYCGTAVIKADQRNSFDRKTVLTVIGLLLAILLFITIGGVFFKRSLGNSTEETMASNVALSDNSTSAPITVEEVPKSEEESIASPVANDAMDANTDGYSRDLDLSSADNNRNHISESTMADATEDTGIEPSHAKEITAEYPLQHKTVMMDQDYMCQVELYVGDWIRASDSGLIRAAWHTVGLSGEPWEISQYGSKHREDSSMIVFGKYSVENVTEGWEITKDNPKQFLFHLHINAGSYGGEPELFIFFSDKTGKRSSSPYSLDCYMESNTWGSVPFAIVVPYIFSPKYPDGVPSVDKTSITLGNFVDEAGYIHINKSW